MPTNLIAVYGTLKKGKALHQAMGEDAEFLGIHPIQNMVMQHVSPHGGYPVLFHAKDTPKEGQTYDVEVWKINDEAFDEIVYIEGGYNPEQITTEWGDARIYIAGPHRYSPELPVIDEFI